MQVREEEQQKKEKKEEKCKGLLPHNLSSDETVTDEHKKCRVPDRGLTWCAGTAYQWSGYEMVGHPQVSI